MVFAKGAIGGDFDLSGGGIIRDQVELQHLDAGLVANDFFGILEAFASEVDFKLGAALSACRGDGSEMGRRGVGGSGGKKKHEGRQAPSTKHQSPGKLQIPGS